MSRRRLSAIRPSLDDAVSAGKALLITSPTADSYLAFLNPIPPGLQSKGSIEKRNEPTSPLVKCLE